MEDFEEVYICKLCLRAIISDKDFKVVDDDLKEILAVLTLKLSYNEKVKQVICTACIEKLVAAFDFKATCIYVENKIARCITSEESKIDFKEIYLKEKQLSRMNSKHKVCRLCMQLIENGKFTPCDKVDGDIVDKYIPEVNFNFAKDPVLCEECFDSLVIHGSFIESCADVADEEVHVKAENVDLSDDGTFTAADGCIGVEDVEMGRESDKEVESMIKMEDTVMIPAGSCAKGKRFVKDENNIKLEYN